MADNPLLQVLNSQPINRQARIVTSQRRVSSTDTPLTREELAAITNRLQRKQRLLKLVLGIKNKSQHNNTLYKFKKKIPQFRGRAEPRALVEYVRVGQEIQRINRELEELHGVRRFVSQQMRHWEIRNA